MADTTIDIQGLGTSSAPLNYELATAQAVEFQAAFATFDGTGAAGAFLPCLQVLAPNGAVMTSIVGSSVAAGASADVTFAPFLDLDKASGGGGITSSQLEVFTSVTLSVNAASSSSYTFTHSSGQTITTGGGSTAPNPLVDGVYLLMANARASTVFNANKGFTMEVLVDTGAAASAGTTSGMYPLGTLNESEVNGTVGCFLPAATGSFQVSVFNGDTAARNIRVQAWVARIG